MRHHVSAGTWACLLWKSSQSVLLTSWGISLALGKLCFCFFVFHTGRDNVLNKEVDRDRVIQCNSHSKFLYSILPFHLSLLFVCFALFIGALRISCSLGWPQTHSITENDLELLTSLAGWDAICLCGVCVCVYSRVAHLSLSTLFPREKVSHWT